MRNIDENTIKILSNCNILREGIDIPVLDFIVFNDVKESFI